MTSWVLLLAASSVGIEAGWKPLATGGHEYTVQIEPELVRLLETGNDLVSEVPSEIHVRSLRITVGKGGVARIEGDAAPTAAAPSAPPAVAAATPHDDLPKFGIDTALPPTDPVPDAVSHAPDESKDQPTPAAKEHSLADTDPPAPDSLPPSDAQAHPLSASPAGFSESPQEHKSEKPSLGGAPGATSAGAPTPWVPFLIAAVLLCCSLGANFYLGWIAWDARNRYRAAVTKLRPAAA